MKRLVYEYKLLVELEVVLKAVIHFISQHETKYLYATKDNNIITFVFLLHGLQFRHKMQNRDFSMDIR